MSDVIIDTVQVALFVDNFKVGNSILLAQKLSDIIKFDSSLDVNNILGDDAPGEIVRIKANGKKQNTEIHISKSKISLYWKNSISENTNFSVDISEVIKTTKELCAKLSDHNGSELIFSRVGYITTVYKKTNGVEEISKLLSENLPARYLLRDIQMTLTYDDVEIGAKIGVNSDVKFNKYLKINTGITNSKREDIALVQHDLNTKQDQALSWTIDVVEKYIQEAALRSEKDAIYDEFFK